MIEGLLSIKSLVYIDLQERTDQVFALIGDGIKLNMVEMETSFFYLAKHFVDISLKWKVTGYHGIKHDTERPNICLFTISTI